MAINKKMELLYIEGAIEYGGADSKTLLKIKSPFEGIVNIIH